MKNCILTPTYEGHFKFIKNYLKTYSLYVEDAPELPLCFVLSSKNEESAFADVIEPYKEKLNIKVYIFDEMMKVFGINTDTDGILEQYGHTSYQMLKKFYSMLYIDCERFLVLDSEAAWIRTTKMLDKFDEFFESPYLIVSEFSSRSRCSEFLADHFSATNHILGYEMEKMPFEHFMWFYKKTVIKDLISKYGQPYDMMLSVYNWEMKERGYSVGLMETMLCLNYIYENAEKYGYRVISAEKELSKYLGKDYAVRYINRFFEDSGGGKLGILEFPCDMIQKENYRQMSKLFRDNGIWITRCDSVDLFNRKYIDWFLKEAGIVLLAVGQDHIYLPELSSVQKIIIECRRTRVRVCSGIKRKIKKLIGGGEQ